MKSTKQQQNRLARCDRLETTKKGEETGAYRNQVDKCYSLVDKLPDDLKEKGATMADRYAKRLADWYNKQF